jgi:two-component system, OmpR family, alkaline phosphatase synthesis response regulator PhoP
MEYPESVTEEPSSPHRYRILLVEDEAALARAVADMLRASSYEVEISGDGGKALEMAQERSYDLIILDVMLPTMDGFEVASELRRRGNNTPILMLTARDEIDDKVGGLRAGADDYLTKPFEAEELLARIEALMRRSARQSGPGLRTYDFGGMRVDFARGRLVRDEKTVDLSEQECRLLQYLVENRGELVSRDTLLKEVWGYDTVPITRTVDVHIAWLRQKIEADPKSPRFIVTVHGRGYRFDG